MNTERVMIHSQTVQDQRVCAHVTWFTDRIGRDFNDPTGGLLYYGKGKSFDV